MAIDLKKYRFRSAALSLMFVLGAQAAAAEVAQESAGGAVQDRFTVTEYRVLGNTVLVAIDIERVLYPQLGAGKTITDVEAVRQSLEKLYKDQGYGTVFVDIPEQTIEEGIVRFKVTEGRVDRVRISGARYFANGAIRARLTQLERGAVMNLPELQAQLGAVNRQSADRSVTPVLKAGQHPGTVDVELKVQDRPPLHGSVEMNDRYSANTTKTRASINLSYDNLFQRFHSLSLQYQVSPQEPRETRVLAATYLAPLQSGNLLALHAVDTNSDFAVLGAGGDLTVLGAGRIYGGRYIFRLPAVRNYFHSFNFGGEYKDFSDHIRLADGATDTTPIAYTIWSGSYGANYNAERGAFGFNIAANFGLRGVVNDEQDFSFKRYQAKANFMYLRADAYREHSLPFGTSLHARLAGQWTADPLISNEQFAIGGASSVRGYIESAQLGDLGLSAGIELRSPSLHRWLGHRAQRVVAFGFYDAGLVSILKWIESQEIDGQIVNVVHDSQQYDLASAGLGLRFSGFTGLEAAVDWGYPLRPSGDTATGDSRIHFQVHYGF